MFDSFNFREQIGPNTLMDKNGTVSEDRLHGNIIGLYFSSIHTIAGGEVRGNPHSRQKFEIIFVSCDDDEASCMSYYENMPWLLIKHTSHARKQLFEKYKVKGIPAMLLFDINGELISRHGRQLILKAPFDKLREAEVRCTIS